METNLTKRNFLKGFAALAAVAAVGLPTDGLSATKDTVFSKHQPMTLSSKRMYFLSTVMDQDRQSEGEYPQLSFQITQQKDDSLKLYTSDQLNQMGLLDKDKIAFYKNLLNEEDIDATYVCHQLIRGSNRVAQKTRRGFGNKITLDGNRAIIWYSKNIGNKPEFNAVDGPLGMLTPENAAKIGIDAPEPVYAVNEGIGYAAQYFAIVEADRALLEEAINMDHIKDHYEIV